VGFPGETEAEFEDTLSLVAQARFDQAYTFQYSARPMTAAAEMPGHLPKEIVQERFERLVALQEEISAERNERMVGRVEEVVVEGPSKRDPSQKKGRTRTNKLVIFPAEEIPEGSRRNVRITGARSHHLKGVLVAPTLRLPVLQAPARA
jgi:tRNA-2-methylthio-N6-dimethylallyladenosine synthase